MVKRRCRAHNEHNFGGSLTEVSWFERRNTLWWLLVGMIHIGLENTMQTRTLEPGFAWFAHDKGSKFAALLHHEGNTNNQKRGRSVTDRATRKTSCAISRMKCLHDERSGRLKMICLERTNARRFVSETKFKWAISALVPLTRRYELVLAALST